MPEKSLPNYEVVPLRKDEIVVAAIQTRAQKVDHKNPKPDIKKRMEHILHLIDLASTRARAPVDLFCFHECVVQGMATKLWAREDFIRLAIEMPGEETELLGKKAKELNAYIEMAAYTKEKDWPGHFFNTSFIVGPNGKVIHNHWKAHVSPGFETATTVQDVLDRFLERYGWDAVWPVVKTDIGNIATFVCSEGFAPETARAFAFKGAEILVRSCGGCAISGMAGGVGDPRFTMRAWCMCNDVWGVFANNAHGQTDHYSVEASAAGSTMIIDNAGKIVQQSESHNEDIVIATIPIAYFRKNHSLPRLRVEIYAPVYAQFTGKYPPNMHSEYLAKDYQDEIEYARRKARW
ncbi:nitrilase-related carbon-nitrogen hydrolase [Chloroflexota bacterium]